MILVCISFSRFFKISTSNYFVAKYFDVNAKNITLSPIIISELSNSSTWHSPSYGTLNSQAPPASSRSPAD